MDDVDATLRTFSVTGSVTDEDQTFRGTEEILRFLNKAGAEFSYTTELIGAQRVDDAHGSPNWTTGSPWPTA